jgi:hypothetical protein
MLWPTYRRAGIGRYEYNAMMREAGACPAPKSSDPGTDESETWKPWNTRKIHGVRLKQGPIAFSFATTGTAGRTKGEDEQNMHAGSARESPCTAQAACMQVLQTATEEKRGGGKN